MTAITERTKVSLFAALGALPFIMGGILWLAAIDAKATEAKVRLDRLEPVIQATHDAVVRIEEALKHGR